MGKHELGNTGRLVSRKEMVELPPRKQTVLHYSRKAGRTLIHNSHHVVSIATLHVVAYTTFEKVILPILSGGSHVA